MQGESIGRISNFEGNSWNAYRKDVQIGRDVRIFHLTVNLYGCVVGDERIGTFVESRPSKDRFALQDFVAHLYMRSHD